MAFDITSVLKDVSRPATGKESIKYISLDLIDPDPNNFYSLEGLDELAGNIELIGLQQPLRVRPGANGRYFVVSGHRRRAACMLIRDGGSEQFADGVPCIIDYGDASPALQELRLIYANSSTRVMNSAEMSKQAERVQTLLYQLKEEGIEFPGRMRDHVAQACKVSKSKLARLHAIRNRLDPSLLKYFDSGDLNEEAAYQLSRLPAEIQAEAGERLASGKQKKLPTAYVVEKVNKNLETYLAEMPCRAHAGGPDCHHKNEKILKSIFAPYEWQTCDPGACCRQCYHAKDCSRACQECKDRRNLEKAVEKEKAEEEQKRKDAEQAMYRKLRQKEAKRLLPLIEAAGLKDEDELPTSGHYWRPRTTAGGIREAARGQFGDRTFSSDSWSPLPSEAKDVAAWSKKLNCTTDYLLGLSKTPKPEAAAVSAPGTDPKWQTGTPEKPGDYVILCGVPKEETPGSWMQVIQKWTGDSWVDGRGIPLRLNVYRWIRIPEV